MKPVESTFGKTPEAIAFNQNIGLSAGRKSLLGDPDKWPKGVAGYNQFAGANGLVEEGFKKLGALGEDETRTPPEKHDKARTVTNRVVSGLKDCETSIRASAKKMIDDAVDAIGAKLDDDRIRDKRFGLVLDFLKRNADTPEGHARVREKVKSDPEVAATIITGKGYLLGLPDQLEANLFKLAHQTHVPEAQKKFDEAEELLRFADNYERVCNGISRHWYNGPIADKMSTRVEI